MKIEDFKFIWDNAIKRAVEDTYNEILQYDINNEFNIKCDISELAFRKIYQEYDNIRSGIRDKYFDRGENDENKMDSHKICACITGALLKVHLVSFDCIGSPHLNVALSNYTIAFNASIYTLYLFVLSDYAECGDEKKYDLLEERATFVFPDTNDGHDSYAQGRIKALALNDEAGNPFDILMYADMLFWIEEYNKEVIRKAIDKR